MVLLASDYDKSKYLKAEDLPREKKFRIKTATEELVGTDRDKEKKLCIWFTNDPRGLVLNKTNNRAIRGAFGDDTAAWSGKIIAIFPTMADFRGTMKPALRVRIPAPKQDPQAATEPRRPAPSSGNGSVATAPSAAPADPELEPDPASPIAEELDDEIGF
jgi:hypothetical protein